MENKDYLLCKYINRPISKLFGVPVGIPVDEAAAIVIPFILFAVMKCFLTAVIAGFIGFVLIKKLKKGQGSAYLLYMMYWFTPVVKAGKTQEVYFLKKAPAPEKRHWL